MLTSRSPPARQTVTQVPQPSTRIFFVAFQYIDQFGNAFSLCDYHILISAFFDGFMFFNGLGPRFFTVSSISLM